MIGIWGLSMCLINVQLILFCKDLIQLFILRLLVHLQSNNNFVPLFRRSVSRYVKAQSLPLAGI